MISVAMISMNEEKAVARVIGDIRAALGTRDYEIVIVDSSRDQTAEIAEKLGARVIRQVPPRGYGRAMGRVLKESRGDVIVTLDCDGTYPADEIPGIATMVLDGECDLVNASRLERRPASMPWPNYFANWLFAVTGRLLVGVKSTDLHSGMRAYSREINALDLSPYPAHGVPAYDPSPGAETGKKLARGPIGKPRVRRSINRSSCALDQFN